MQRENPIWKILTLFFAALSIAASFYFHFDSKRSTENKIVEALSERYASVDREMSYEQALEAVDKDIEKLKTDNAMLQSENDNLLGEVSALKNENERSEKIALAESYANLGNYEVALIYLIVMSSNLEEVGYLII